MRVKPMKLRAFSFASRSSSGVYLVGAALVASTGCAAFGWAPAEVPAPNVTLLPECAPHRKVLSRLEAVRWLMKGTMEEPPASPDRTRDVGTSRSPILAAPLRKRAQLLAQWASETRSTPAPHAPWGTTSAGAADRFAAAASAAASLAEATAAGDDQAMEAARTRLAASVEDANALAAAGSERCLSPAPSPLVEGPASPQPIERTIHAHLPAWRACYARGFQDNPRPPGPVEVRFGIDRDGSVSWAVPGDADRRLLDCVMPDLAREVFPPAVRGTGLVVHSIDLSEGGRVRDAKPPVDPAAQRAADRMDAAMRARWFLPLDPYHAGLTIGFFGARFTDRGAERTGVNPAAGGMYLAAGAEAFDLLTASVSVGGMWGSDADGFSETVVDQHGNVSVEESSPFWGILALSGGLKTPDLRLSVDPDSKGWWAMSARLRYGYAWIDGERSINGCVDCSSEGLEGSRGSFVEPGVNVGFKAGDSLGLTIHVDYRYYFGGIALAGAVQLGLGFWSF